MRYTKYVMGDKIVNINGIVSERKYLKDVSILFAIPVAMTGVAVLSGLLVFALIFDGTNYSIKKIKIYNNELHAYFNRHS